MHMTQKKRRNENQKIGKKSSQNDKEQKDWGSKVTNTNRCSNGYTNTRANKFKNKSYCLKQRGLSHNSQTKTKLSGNS